MDVDRANTWGSTLVKNRDDNKTYILVKLSESFSNAIQEYSAPKIKFYGSRGAIKFPNGKSYDFSLEQSDNTVECIRQTRNRWESVGKVACCLHVKGKDDVYQRTRTKMEAAEQEKRKYCTKLLDSPEHETTTNTNNRSSTAAVIMNNTSYTNHTTHHNNHANNHNHPTPSSLLTSSSSSLANRDTICRDRSMKHSDISASHKSSSKSNHTNNSLSSSSSLASAAHTLAAPPVTNTAARSSTKPSSLLSSLSSASSSSSSSASSSSAAPGTSSTGASSNNLVNLSKYPDIIDVKQMKRYKAEFDRDFKEYQHLHGYLHKIEDRFRKMKERLNQTMEGSSEWDLAKDEIFSEYERLKGDSSFHKARSKYKQLYDKLAHIKKKIFQFKHEHRDKGNSRKKRKR